MYIFDMNKEGRKVEWTKIICKEIASLYTTKSEFKLKCPGAYSATCRNGWMDEICSHMIRSGNRYHKCIYSYEFPDNHVYVGLTYNLNSRQAHRDNDKDDAVTKYIFSTGLNSIRKQLTDYIPVEDAIREEAFWQTKYLSDGWIPLHCAKPGGIGGSIVIWTKEACIKEGLKYDTKTAFARTSTGAYSSAVKNGWLQEIYSRMKDIRKPRKYWTLETCGKEASKYDSRSSFNKNALDAYAAAIRGGWLDTICTHMKRPDPWNKKKQ